MNFPSRRLRLFVVSVLLSWTGCLSMPGYRMLEDVSCHEELAPIAPGPTKGPEGS